MMYRIFLLLSAAVLPLCSCVRDLDMGAGQEPVVVVECVLQDTSPQTLKLFYAKTGISTGMTPIPDAGIVLVDKTAGQEHEIRDSLSAAVKTDSRKMTVTLGELKTDVRGGNSGNNLFSLDGVPVYGYSHLLGLTTAIPQSVMGSVSLSKSDFDGSDSNFTAAHLKIESRLPKEDGAT